MERMCVAEKKVGKTAQCRADSTAAGFVADDEVGAVTNQLAQDDSQIHSAPQI